MTLKKELKAHMRVGQEAVREFGNANGMLTARARGELKTAIGHAQLDRFQQAATSLGQAEDFLNRTSAGSVHNMDALEAAITAAQTALANSAQDSVQAIQLAYDTLKRSRVSLESVQPAREGPGGWSAIAGTAGKIVAYKRLMHGYALDVQAAGPNREGPWIIIAKDVESGVPTGPGKLRSQFATSMQAKAYAEQWAKKYNLMESTRSTESLASDTERLARQIEKVMREVNTHRGRVHREMGLHADEADSLLLKAEDDLLEAFGLVKKVGKLV